MSEKQKTIQRPIHGDPFHPNRITGWEKIAVEDGEHSLDTVIQDGKVVPLTKKPSTLHKPQDIGIQDWQQRDLIEPDPL